MAQPASNPKIEELRFRLKSDPRSRLFFPLAEELRKIEQFGEAEQVLRAGLGHNPSYLSAWVSLGRVLREQDKHRDAAEALTRALQLDPGNVVAARLLADSYFDLGDKIEAIKKYKLVRALLPADDEQLEVVIGRLEHDLTAPTATPFIADSEPAPLPETAAPEVLATEGNQVFSDAAAGMAEEQHIGERTADREPMRPARLESAEGPTPWSEDDAASEVFAPAETPAPAPQAGDLANTVTMADLYMLQGFPDKAREIYQNILQREPENREVRDKLKALAASGARNPKVAKLEQWLAKVKKREEGSVV